MTRRRSRVGKKAPLARASRTPGHAPDCADLAARRFFPSPHTHARSSYEYVAMEGGNTGRPMTAAESESYWR